MKNLHKILTDLFKVYAGERAALEEEWIQYWTLYCPTAASYEYANSRSAEQIGEVGTEWRHRLSGTKTFVAIEQLHSYLMSGMFPTEYWLSLTPGIDVLDKDNTDLEQQLRVLSRYICECLSKSNFYSKMALAIRQLLIIGMSPMEPIWEDGELRFEVGNMFDVWLDPTRDDPSRNNVFRRVLYSVDDIRDKISSGVFDQITLSEFNNRIKADGRHDTLSYEDALRNEGETAKDIVASFFSVSRIASSNTIWYPLYEFWGKVFIDDEVKSVYAIFDDKHLYLVDFDVSDRNFTLASYIPVTAGIQPYGLSSTQPSKGLATAMNISLNHRLDGQEYAINPAWGAVDDNVIPKPSELVIEPGSVIPMAQQNNLFPLVQPNLANMGINMSEMLGISSMIDQAYGTVPGVGLSPQRNADRVTAEEVASQRDAGGLRIANYISHLERDFLLPLIRRTINVISENIKPVKNDYEFELIGIVGMPETSDSVSYYPVLKRWFKYEMNVVTSGSRMLLEKAATLSAIDRLLTFASKVPQAMELLDMPEIIRMYLTNSNIQDPDKLLIKQKPQTEQAAPSVPGDTLSARNDTQTNLALDPEGMAAIGAKLSGTQKPLEELVNGSP